MQAGLSGLTALHMAACSDLSLPLLNALLDAGADARVVTQDGHRRGDAGGRTALHLAAAHGAAACATRLLAARPEASVMANWDDEFPAHAAWRAGHSQLAYTLAQRAKAFVEGQVVADGGYGVAAGGGGTIGDIDAEAVATMADAVAGGPCGPAEAAEAASLHAMEHVERERERLSLAGRPRLQVRARLTSPLLLSLLSHTRHCTHGSQIAHLVRSLWSEAECDWLLGELRVAAALVGWQHKRHRHYATEDIPMWRAPAACAWLLERMRTQVTLPRNATGRRSPAQLTSPASLPD